MKLIFFGLETKNEILKGFSYSVYLYFEKLIYVIIILVIDVDIQAQVALIICVHFLVSFFVTLAPNAIASSQSFLH